MLKIPYKQVALPDDPSNFALQTIERLVQSFLLFFIQQLTMLSISLALSVHVSLVIREHTFATGANTIAQI